MKKLRIVSGLRPAVAKPEEWSLRDFYDRRNNVLLFRASGGLGDILMHRMVFEDFKLLNPQVNLTFACPAAYINIVNDHPFVDSVVDSNSVNRTVYPVCYDTTTVCGRTEMGNAPGPSPHRSDIWAGACGIKLTRHNMHLSVNPDELAEAREHVKGSRICIAPSSAISSKNLGPDQVAGICQGLKDRGLSYYGLHTGDVKGFEGRIYSARNAKHFISLVAAADYVISVDSAAFHVGGGLNIPTVGVFSWADGKVYGKYYSKWELVQKHRDDGWDCGPCYTWTKCPKAGDEQVSKPCITEIRSEEILDALDRVMAKWPSNSR